MIPVRWISLLAVIGSLFLAIHAVDARFSALPAPGRFELSDGASSIDELIARLMVALEAKDKASVDRCRVTKAEYIDFVLPGAGAVGDPPRHYNDQMNDYAWGTLNGKSIYFRANLMNDFGGHHYKIKGYEFRKGVHDYAWYRAHQRITIFLEAENGHDAILHTGSIIEVNGKYKFISLIND